MLRSGTYFSTEMFAPHDRTDAWRAQSRLLWDCISDTVSSQPKAIEGSLFSRPIGAMIGVRADYTAQQCRRDTKIIVQSGLDHYLVHCYLSGTHIGQFDGCELTGNPGDIRIIDLSRPFASKVEAGETASLMLPRNRLAPLLGGRNIHGMVLKADSPMVKLLRSLILSVNTPDFIVTAEQGLVIEDSAVQLVHASLSTRLTSSMDRPGLADILRSRVSQFINANLFDPELGPGLLMRQFRVSRAHLYRMFEGEGGVSGAIRTKRLDAAYRSLLHPANSHQRIIQIAYKHGFSNSNQFLRAFKTRFGLAPSEARGLKGQPLLKMETNPLFFALADNRMPECPPVTVATTSGEEPVAGQKGAGINCASGDVH